jgi:release factor glutamine methyltransferase
MQDVLAPSERFALVLADPPWVPSAEVARFPADPRRAIDGGPDGLDLARLCVAIIARHLAEDGASVLQLGDATQAEVVRRELRSHDELDLRVVEVRPVPGGEGVLLHLSRGRPGGEPSAQFT